MLARHAQHTALIMPSANCSCEESAETFSSDAARDRLLDDGRLLGRSVHTTAMTNTRARTRCQGLGAGSGQHLLRAAHASSRAKTAALEALVEVGGRGGSGSAVSVVAERAAGPGTIVGICLPSSQRLPRERPLVWCWPTPRSTAREITPTSGASSGRRV